MFEMEKRPRYAPALVEGHTPAQKVQQWMDAIESSDYIGHDAMIPKLLKMESVTFTPSAANPNDARSVFSFVVPKELCNAGGLLHGGAVALIFDITTSITIRACCRKGFWDMGHVSRNLNVTFLRPAPQGTKVIVESWVTHLGKRMGQTMGEMRLEDGKVCYTCEHGKVQLDAPNL